MRYTLAIALLLASTTQAIRIRKQQTDVEAVDADTKDLDKETAAPQQSTEAVAEETEAESEDGEAKIGAEDTESEDGAISGDSSLLSAPLIEPTMFDSLSKEQTEEIYKGMVSLKGFFAENGLMTEGDCTSFQFKEAQDLCNNNLDEYKELFIQELPLIFNENTDDQLFINMCLINTNQREINRLLEFVVQDLQEMEEGQNTGAEQNEAEGEDQDAQTQDDQAEVGAEDEQAETQGDEEAEVGAEDEKAETEGDEAEVGAEDKKAETEGDEAEVGAEDEKAETEGDEAEVGAEDEKAETEEDKSEVGADDQDTEDEDKEDKE